MKYFEDMPAWVIGYYVGIFIAAPFFPHGAVANFIMATIIYTAWWLVFKVRKVNG